MYRDTVLSEYVDTRQTLDIEALCIVELNQNDPTNVNALGVFKAGQVTDKWLGDPNTYVKHDFITTEMRKSITEDELIFFGKRPKSDYFNLADCFTEFRPRSGILKTVMPFSTKQVYLDDFKSVRRPRYYVPSIKDEFKYWTSWTTGTTGLSSGTNLTSNSNAQPAYAIQNANPFIVYNRPVPANKITVKIQTGIGKFFNRSKSLGTDPLSNPYNSTIPREWKIQYLDVDTWRDIYSFMDFDQDILNPETGTLDLVYMIVNPAPSLYHELEYRGEVPTVAHLPLISTHGDAYSVGANNIQLGTLYIYDGSKWVNHGAMRREWTAIDSLLDPKNYAIEKIVDPTFYNPANSMYRQYSDFKLMYGLRIVVQTMLSPFRPFELIELSPRLVVDISNNVEAYSLDKAISEDNVLPVGDMSVSSGSINISNIDMLLNKEIAFDHNTGKGSLLADRINKNSKFILCEIIHCTDLPEPKHYCIPCKVLYATGTPTVVSGTDVTSTDLRDLTFYFEERNCPNIVLKQCSLSKAVATVLDTIGFTNYMFKFSEGVDKDGLASVETIIPYYFVSEEMNVAEALQALSVATQSAMFFDEYNNFVVMPRKHFGTDAIYTLRGQKMGNLRPNIESIDSASIDIVADAEIKFTNRELARAEMLNFTPLNQNASYELGEQGALLGYKVTPLWDASELEQSSLGVAVLNTRLTNAIPVYDPLASTETTIVKNAIVDVGLWGRLLPNYEGFLMIDGEVIRYDAKQYSIAGKLHWVTSANHLEELRGGVGFKQTTNNDQIGVPTGLLRIWTELEGINSAIRVRRHGRGVYNTPIMTHEAEPTTWLGATAYYHSDTAYDTIYGDMALSNFTIVGSVFGATTTGSSKISNFMYNPIHSQYSPIGMNPANITPQSATALSKDKRIMRSSALTIAGPPDAAVDKVTMRLKKLTGNGYSVFGTRIGIVGIEKATPTEDKAQQTPLGSAKLGTYTTGEGDEAKTETVYGSGGGLVFFSSRIGGTRLSDDGYYFEIAALDGSYSSEISSLDNSVTNPAVKDIVFPNINFYKINRGTLKNTGGKYNVAVKLFSTYMDVRVTTGSQHNRGRLIPEASNVYDLAVEMKEYKVVPNSTNPSGVIRRFYLYVNDILVGTVEDIPGANGYLPLRYQDTEVGLFVRGKSTLQFEHIYAIGNDALSLQLIVNPQTIGTRAIEFKAFSPSEIWNTINLAGGKDNRNRYYDEFGAIARECRKIEAKFSLYPAFASSVAKMPFNDRAYSVSHYTASPFSATMLVSAQSDASIALIDSTALSIYGLTFADNKEQSLRLDDYLIGNYDGSSQLVAYDERIKRRNDLLAKRSILETNKMEVSSMYIQNRQYALKFMNWVSGFVGMERLRLEVKTFGTPHLQVGDIVKVDYDIPYTTEIKAARIVNRNPTQNEYETKTVHFHAEGKRFMIRKISIGRSQTGSDTTVSLVELPSREIWNAGDW